MMHWQNLTTAAIAEAAERDAVVVVTVGATEQHGAHLPSGTDSMCAQAIATEAARIANDAGQPTLVAPPVWVGYSRDHDAFAGTLSVGHRTLSLFLVDIGVSIMKNGFKRLLILNGHGSNDRLLYYVLRDIQDKSKSSGALCAVTYWKTAADIVMAERESSPGGMAHACEFETSLMLHYHGDLVRMQDAKDERASEYSSYRRQDLFAAGPVMAPDRFDELSRSGVVGDPTLATAAKGASWGASIAARVADLIKDMATWPLTGPEAGR